MGVGEGILVELLSLNETHRQRETRERTGTLAKERALGAVRQALPAAKV